MAKAKNKHWRKKQPNKVRSWKKGILTHAMLNKAAKELEIYRLNAGH